MSMNHCARVRLAELIIIIIFSLQDHIRNFSLTKAQFEEIDNYTIPEHSIRCTLSGNPITDCDIII